MMALSSFPAKEVELGKSPNWLELPTDITANILQRLGTFEIVTSACLVCTLWWNICKDPFMWRSIHLHSCFRHFFYNPLPICRYVVKRSCGQLEDITIEQFGTDDTLKYIADCARHLLANCPRISDKGLNEVAKKLPLLEELDISFNKLKGSLEIIGRSCPLLKSLKLRQWFFKYVKCGDEAFAIAKTMPGLRHLNISGSLITDVGLLAILDGCPLLESLDLKECFQLDLTGSWRKGAANK